MTYTVIFNPTKEHYQALQRFGSALDRSEYPVVSRSGFQSSRKPKTISSHSTCQAGQGNHSVSCKAPALTLIFPGYEPLGAAYRAHLVPELEGSGTEARTAGYPDPAAPVPAGAGFACRPLPQPPGYRVLPGSPWHGGGLPGTVP
jgi:hypothetical protein